MTQVPLAIIGAGPSGLMLASLLRLQGKPFVLFESQKQVGQKILISGGGRCNILPSHLQLTDYESFSPKKMLQRILGVRPLAEWKAFFEETLKIPLVIEPDTGKWFPQSQSAKQLLRQWLSWLQLSSEELKLQHRLIDFQPNGDGYLLHFEQYSIACQKLVLATGGFSYPKTGSDGTGWKLLKKYVPMHPAIPALAPLLAKNDTFFPISGYALKVQAQAKTLQGQSLFESRSDLLFTHFGYSGPAAMDLSFALKFPNTVFSAKLLEKDFSEWNQILDAYPKGKQLNSFLEQYFSKAFGDILLSKISLAKDKTFSQLRREEKKHLLTHLSEFPLEVYDSRGFGKAEVTSGGLDLSEVNLKTLEMKALPNCYILGELLDCTGRIGGYNFLWAFSTALVASRAF